MLHARVVNVRAMLLTLELRFVLRPAASHAISDSWPHNSGLDKKSDLNAMVRGPMLGVLLQLAKL